MKETTGKVVKQRGIKMLFPLLAMMLGILLSVGVGDSASAAKKVWVQTSSTYYSYDNGKWVKSGESKDTYDKKGRNTVHESKNVDGATIRLLGGKEYKNVKSDKSVYTFDKKNRIKQRIEYFDGKKVEKSVYTYNSKGKVKTEKRYDAKNKKICTNTYKYDSKGNVVKKVTKAKGSKTTTTTHKYKYNKKIIVKDTVKYSDGSSEVWEYTNKGVLKKYTSKSSDYFSTTTYDSKERAVKYEYESSSYGSGIINYEYEKTSDGKVKKWTVAAYNGKSPEPRYLSSEETIDKNGNVTERIEYVSWEDTDENGDVVTGIVPWSKYVYKYKKVPTYTVK